MAGRRRILNSRLSHQSVSPIDDTMAVLFAHSNPTTPESNATPHGERDRVNLSLPTGSGDRVAPGAVTGADSGTANHTPGLGCPPAGVRFPRRWWLELVESEFDGLSSRTAPGSDRGRAGEVVGGRFRDTALSTVVCGVQDFRGITSYFTGSLN